MPFFRNFTYWIDKRNWKYYFLMVALAMDQSMRRESMRRESMRRLGRDYNRAGRLIA
jgi:hypothetical protein